MPQITEEIVEVIQPGTRLSRYCATTSAWRDRAENCGGSTVAAFSGLVCNVRRVVQTVQATVVFLQLQLPGHPGSVRALDDEEFFVMEGSWGWR